MLMINIGKLIKSVHSDVSMELVGHLRRRQDVAKFSFTLKKPRVSKEIAAGDVV